MSINHISEFLKPGSRVHELQGNNRYMYCFVYDHYLNWQYFLSKLPTCRLLGPGVIPNWTFHVNEKGQPNVRRAFIDGSIAHLSAHQYVVPAPATQITTFSRPITYGWIFQVPQRDDPLLHNLLSRGNRIRTLQTAMSIVTVEPNRAVKVPCILYWDPRHTCDLRRSIIHDPKIRNAWDDGIKGLRLAGMPFWAAKKIFNHLSGLTEDVEPLLVCPAQLPKGSKEKYLHVPNQGQGILYNRNLPVNSTPGHSDMLDTPPTALTPRHTRIWAKMQNRATLVVKGIAFNEDGSPTRIDERNFTHNNNNQIPRAPSMSDAHKATKRARDPVGNGGSAKKQKRLLIGATSMGQRARSVDVDH